MDRPAPLAPAVALAFAAVLPSIPPAAVAGGSFETPFTALPWFPVGTDTAQYFGFSIAPAGDVDGDGDGDLLVGSFSFDPQSPDAQLYLGSPQGPSAIASWTWNSGQRGPREVSSAGDVNGDGYFDVLVGLPEWSEGGQDKRGRVAVFHGGPGGLPPAPTYDLVSPTPAADQQFGFSVAPAGDVNGDGHADVIIGADQYTSGGFTRRGAAFVYHGGPSGLAPAPARTLVGPAESGVRFGHDVATAGDVNADGFDDVVIGGPNAGGSSGIAALHFGSATGVLAAPDTVLAGGGQSLLGWSVATAGDVDGDDHADVLVGSPGHDTARGRTYLLLGGPQGPVAATLVPSIQVSEHERWGTDVATLGDLDGDGFADFGISAKDFDHGNKGRVSIYTGRRGGYTYVGEIVPPDPPSAFNFGESIASSGDVDGDGLTEIAVGDPYADFVVEPFGAAFLFRAPRTLPALADDWPHSGPQPGTRFAAAVAILANGSDAEYGTLAIGDPGHDGVGRVSFHPGFDPYGVYPFEDLQDLEGTIPFQNLGARLVDVGDFDRDGYGDIAVSSPTADSGLVSQAGRVAVHGRFEGVPGPPRIVVAGGRDFDRVGSALAGRGDVDGDGFHDLLVGAREWDSASLADCGKAWLIRGTSGPPGPAAWTREGSSLWQGLGASVALADFDGDGYSDAIVGSASPPSGTPQPGRVEVFFGSAGGLANSPGLVLTSPTGQASFGATVASIGDVTGDRVADLAVGAPEENGTGRVFVYSGSVGRSQSRIATWSKQGTQAGGRFGEAIGGGGDVDADGRADFVIGEPGWDDPVVDAGRVHLFRGANFAPEPNAAWTFSSGLLGLELGASVTAVADLSGDSFADFAVGAPGAGGRVYPFLGGGGQGRRQNLLLFEPFANQRRFHPARVADPNDLSVRFLLHSAAGRTRVTYQAEVALQNAAYTGVPTLVTPFFYDTSAPGLDPTVRPSFPHSWPGHAFRLRGRLVSKSPYFPRTRWFTESAHVSGDHDERAPGAVVSVPGPVAAEAAIRVSPNPSRLEAAARVDFALREAGEARLEVFDVRGARVRILASGPRAAGAASVGWDGRDDAGRAVAPGLYFVVLEAAGGREAARLVRLP